MKKLKTTMKSDSGEEKEITVWLDDNIAVALEASGDEELVRQYIIEEYKSKLIERRETRRHVSLDNSLDNGFDIADQNVNMEADTIKAEDLQKLHKAIDCLEPQQKWLIEQIYFLGRTHVEIAQELGVGESAIRSRLKKIYEKIKKFLI